MSEWPTLCFAATIWPSLNPTADLAPPIRPKRHRAAPNLSRAMGAMTRHQIEETS